MSEPLTDAEIAQLQADLSAANARAARSEESAMAATAIVARSTALIEDFTRRLAEAVEHTASLEKNLTDEIAALKGALDRANAALVAEQAAHAAHQTQAAEVIALHDAIAAAANVDPSADDPAVSAATVLEP